jgi:hypothetical protein
MVPLRRMSTYHSAGRSAPPPWASPLRLGRVRGFVGSSGDVGETMKRKMAFMLRIRRRGVMPPGSGCARSAAESAKI